MTAVTNDGLDLGHRRAALGTAGWRLRAAPWILPILDGTNGASVHGLLQAVERRQLDFVEPGTNPMPYEEDLSTLRDTLAAVTVYAQRLTKWTDLELRHTTEAIGTPNGETIDRSRQLPRHHSQREQINRSLSKTNFRKAAEQMPVSGPAALRDRQGSSYTWAILNDSRISAGAW